jgi:hypothetical protein
MGKQIRAAAVNRISAIWERWHEEDVEGSILFQKPRYCREQHGFDSKLICAKREMFTMRFHHPDRQHHNSLITI